MTTCSVIVAFVAAAFLFQSTDARTYNVGDGLNWVEPPTNNTYSIWASRHVFVKGDILVFNFTTGIHNVAEVTRRAYRKCNTSSPFVVHSQSPVRIPLTKKGRRYFISSLNNDCQKGQKLGVNVLARSPPPPATAPTPLNSAPPPLSPPPGPLPATAPTPISSSPPSSPPAAPNSVPTPPSPPRSSLAPSPFGPTFLSSVFVSLIVVLLCLAI